MSSSPRPARYLPTWESKLLTLAVWAVCTMLLALVPFGILFALNRVRGIPSSWHVLLGTGDLALISAVLSADAFGRVVKGRDVQLYVLRMLASLLSLLFILAASTYFAVVVSEIEGHQENTRQLARLAAGNPFYVSPLTNSVLQVPVNQSNVAADSSVFFLGSICLSVGAILIEEN